MNSLLPIGSVWPTMEIARSRMPEDLSSAQRVVDAGAAGGRQVRLGEREGAVGLELKVARGRRWRWGRGRHRCRRGPAAGLPEATCGAGPSGICRPTENSQSFSALSRLASLVLLALST